MNRKKNAGGGPLPPGYAICFRRMAIAAARWIEERGKEGLAFSLPPDDGVMFIAPLSDEAIEMLGANEMAREFLRAMDAAAEHEATAFLACQIIRAMELPVTDWTEEFWHSMLAKGNAVLMQRGAKPGQA